MQRNIRETIQFYLIDCKTPLGKLIDIWIILLNFIVCGIFVIETYEISENLSAILWNVELGIVAFFIIEYIARLYGAPDRLKQVVDIYSIIDVLAIIPTLLILLFPFEIGFIRVIRILRVFRIFRFLRFMTNPEFFFGVITMQLLRVARLVFTLFIIFFVSSGAFYAAESKINPRVEDFGDAFYFSVVTLTTVGFGDIIPLSDWGKLIVVLMIFSGIILIPWEASQIVREWIHISQKKTIICPQCGLKFHDKDASHCKSCGHVIYQEFDGD